MDTSLKCPGLNIPKFKTSMYTCTFFHTLSLLIDEKLKICDLYIYQLVIHMFRHYQN